MLTHQSHLTLVSILLQYTQYISVTAWHVKHWHDQFDMITPNQIITRHKRGLHSMPTWARTQRLRISLCGVGPFLLNNAMVHAVRLDWLCSLPLTLPSLR